MIVPKQHNGSCGVCARFTCDGECCDEPTIVKRNQTVGEWEKGFWYGLIAGTLLSPILMMAITLLDKALEG